MSQTNCGSKSFDTEHPKWKERWKRGGGWGGGGEVDKLKHKNKSTLVHVDEED